MEARAGYYRAPGANMGGRVVADIFFAVADGWLGLVAVRQVAIATGVIGTGR